MSTMDKCSQLLTFQIDLSRVVSSIQVFAFSRSMNASLMEVTITLTLSRVPGGSTQSVNSLARGMGAKFSMLSRQVRQRSTFPIPSTTSVYWQYTARKSDPKYGIQPLTRFHLKQFSRVLERKDLRMSFEWGQPKQQISDAQYMQPFHLHNGRYMYKTLPHSKTCRYSGHFAENCRALSKELLF